MGQTAANKNAVVNPATTNRAALSLREELGIC